MSAEATRWKSSDLVPLADRLRYLTMFRIAAAALTVIFVELQWVGAGADTSLIIKATLAFIFFAGAGYALWSRLPGRGLFLFGSLLIADGVFLVWVSFATGGAASPLRFLILLHLITVALLASYRTAVKLAIWHSMLLFGILYLEQAGLFQPIPGDPAIFGATPQSIGPFVTILWLVALSTATFSAVNERELRRRRYDLEALAKMSAELEQATQPVEVAEALLESVADTFELVRSVVIVGVGDEEPVVLSGRGIDMIEQAEGTVRLGGDSLIKRAWQTRTTVLTSQASSADPWLRGVLPRARNLVFVPMSAEGRCIALLVAEHGLRNGSRIERRVLTMVERFAGQAAMALNGAALLAQMREQAATDALTGLANRRTFQSELDKNLSRAGSIGEQVSLVMLDIDHFKSLNDRFGHQVGDQVIREVACVLALSCRDFDTAARYGGEEFALILPGCNEANAIATAERLRIAVSQLALDSPVTVSAGTATFPLHATEPGSLIKAADDALYEAKRAGRNRVAGAPRAVQVHIAPPREERRGA